MAYIDDFGCEYSDDKKTFVRCPKDYQGHYTIAEGVTSIGDYAFYNCSGLTSVTIGNSVTSIGKYAFSGCSGLTSVTIPDSVTSIYYSAFANCSGLISITIPDSVTSIGEDAFYDTAWLSNQPDGVIYINQSFYKYKGEMPENTSIVVREGTTQICGSAFYKCSGLTSITIPNSVTSIGSSVLSGCSGLTSVTIGNSVTSIGRSAFSGCSGLTSITIPTSVTSIGEYAFSGCSGLTSVTIPNSVTSIGYQAFEGCSGLTSITLPNSVTSIGEEVFKGCSSLTSITIPNSVTSIGAWVFHSCSGLTSIVVENGNPEYDSRDNCNAIIETATNTLIAGCQLTIIPNSVTRIGYSVFRGCSGLTSVTIPNSVTSIEYGAFMKCSSLTSVVWNAKNCVIVANDDPITFTLNDLPFYDIASQITSFTFGNEVEHIPAYLCYKMSNLTSITIPSSVTRIGYEAFVGCSGLTSITIPNSVTSIGEKAFAWCSGLTSMVVASGNSKYDSRDNCNAIIETATNTLIAGCQLTIIPNSVTSIGRSAFRGCGGLTSVTLGKSVTSIGDEAFANCSGLTSITIPNSVTSIGEKAFEKCDALQTIFVPVGQKARFAAMGLPAAKIVERNNEKLQQLLTLAQVYEAGVIEPKDMAKAVRYYEGAIEEGSAEAAYHLGELYRNGKEVAADLQLAVNYFRKAADNHYKDAAQQLAECCEALERYNRQMEQFMHADEPQVEPYYLFFDTETNGLPRNYQAPISATDNWPRLIQIGWIVTDAEGNELQAGNHLVYPDGFTIPSDVERLTGISYSQARSEGKDLKEVLTEFMQQFNAVKHIVGHNIDFDLHIVGAELYRKNMPVNTILSKPYTCTMRSTIDFCKLPPFTYGSWKFPKLQELYHKLFGTQFAQAHDAMNDIRATQKCFFELKKRGII